MKLARSLLVLVSRTESRAPASTEEKSDYQIKELRSEDEWHKSAYGNLVKETSVNLAECYKGIISFLNSKLFRI